MFRVSLLIAAGLAAGCSAGGPILTAVSPACGPAATETTIQIQGERLSPPRVDLATARASTYRAALDGTPLLAVSWRSATELSAVVPAGLPAGVHRLSVDDPRGAVLDLPNAYRSGCPPSGDGGDAPDADVADAPEATGTLVFNDPFDVVLPDWSHDAIGVWDVSGGALHLTPDLAGDRSLDGWVGPRTETDYRVQARLVINTVDNALLASAGILMRVQPPATTEDRYYFCGIRASPPSVVLEVHDSPATAPVTLGSATFAGAVPGFVFILYGIVQGTSITCGTDSVSPAAVVTATDATYPTGSWGLRAIEVTATIDEIWVYSPP